MLNEEDLVRTIKKDEFEAIIAPHVQRFAELIEETIKASGLTHEQIHFVELFGDATRTPIILETTCATFKKEQTERTLSSLEAVARGAAL